MNSARTKLHILYEHGGDAQPYSTSYIRLLQPFTHPSLAEHLTACAGVDYAGEDADLVVVERLWRPDITLDAARNLVARVERAGARLLYAIDDNFLDFPAEGKDWLLSAAQRQVVEFFLGAADSVMVSTPALRDRLAGYNASILVVPQALDERLLWGSTQKWGGAGAVLQAAWRRARGAAKPLIIGYMGTFTHDEDLLMIAPALRTLQTREPGRFELQIIGVVHRPATLSALEGLPYRVVGPPPGCYAYPAFMRWFSRSVSWDLALAPLCDNPFNRCKSDIKFLDYCALGVAGIYSRVPAYASSVAHGETGWLADNDAPVWATALERLLSDTELRQSVAARARSYLHAERVLRRQAWRWSALVDDVLQNQAVDAVVGSDRGQYRPPG